MNLLFGSPLKAGMPAPAFSLPDQTGKTRQLADFRGRWLVLFFYPKDDSFACTREACSFRDESELFRQLGAEVLGISTDDTPSHLKFAEKHALSYPLLSDVKLEVSKAYGVLLPGGISNRVTFLIDPQGKVADRLDWVNWFNYGKSVADRLKALQTTKEAKI